VTVEREAFELVKFEGLSVAEAADVLGVTRATVKIRTHRATVALRKAVVRSTRETVAATTSRDVPHRGSP
jgi:RNA polymerase sigma-70 factor (ECF subfamily)